MMGPFGKSERMRKRAPLGATLGCLGTGWTIAQPRESQDFPGARAITEGGIPSGGGGVQHQITSKNRASCSTLPYLFSHSFFFSFCVSFHLGFLLSVFNAELFERGQLSFLYPKWFDNQGCLFYSSSFSARLVVARCFRSMKKPVFGPWQSLLVIAALAPSLAPTAFAQVTVPVYVPGYQAENWDDLAGSVITSVRETILNL